MVVYWWEKNVNEGYGLQKFTNVKGRGPWTNGYSIPQNKEFR